MLTKDLLTELNALIAKDELPTLISRLQTVLKGSDLFYEVLLQSAQLADISKEIRNGTVSFENANLQKNQIRQSLIDIVKLLDGKIQSDQPISQQVETTLQNANYSYTQQHSGNGDNVAGDKTVIHNAQKGDIIYGDKKTLIDLSSKQIIMIILLSLVAMIGFAIVKNNTQINTETKMVLMNEHLEHFKALENAMSILSQAEIDSEKFNAASDKFDQLRIKTPGLLNDPELDEMLSEFFSKKNKVIAPNSQVSQGKLRELSIHISTYIQSLKN